LTNQLLSPKDSLAVLTFLSVGMTGVQCLDVQWEHRRTERGRMKIMKHRHARQARVSPCPTFFATCEKMVFFNFVNLRIPNIRSGFDLIVEFKIDHIDPH